MSFGFGPIRPLANDSSGAGSVGRRGSLPRRGRRTPGHPHARLVHAPGRSQPARVRSGARRRLDPGRDQPARTGGGDHPAARSALRRRRRRPLQRHRRPGPRRGLRHRCRSRLRTGRRAAAAQPRRSRPSPAARPLRHRLRRRDREDRRRRARHRRAGARFRRRSLHGGQLPDRGPPEPHLRAHQGPHAHRRSAVARRDGPPGRRSPSPSSTSSWRTGPRRSSSSTRGPGRSRAATTSASCCPIRGGCSPSSPPATRRRPRSTSASAVTICWRRCGRPGPA